MKDMRLADYIRQQIQAGYDIRTVRTFLIRNGYNVQTVNDTISYLGIQQQRRTEQPSQEQLFVNYFKQYQRQGYTIQQIQQSLLQKGYSPFTVQRAMQTTTKKPFFTLHMPALHMPSISKHFVFIALLIVLITVSVGGIAWFFMNMEFKVEQNIDYGLSIDIDVLTPGDTLYITNDFINFPEKRDYAITIYYTINDKEKLTRVDSWQVSFDKDEPLTRSIKHGLTQTIEQGIYELNAKMSYGTQNYQAYTSFIINMKPEEEVENKKEKIAKEVEKSGGEIEEATEKVKSSTEWKVITADDYKKYAEAKELATVNVAEAILYCDAIIDATKKDECYSAVARNSGLKDYCSEVVSDPTRDACLIDFAFNKNDYTVCNDIANPFVQQSCNQLKQVAALQQ